MHTNPRAPPPQAIIKLRKFDTIILSKNSKLDLGTIKNGISTSDLPPEGPKKERRGNLSNLSKI